MANADARKIKAMYTSAPIAHRQTMLSMRNSILQIIPDAEEVISYGMPAFKFRGNIVAGIRSAKNHVGYYPFSGSVLALFPAELKGFRKTKSALHVPIGKPLSKALLKKLISARISQCPVATRKIDIKKYAKLDTYWKSLGIAAPARRGLVDSKILKLSDLTRLKESEFLAIHAIGPRASKIIKREMKRRDVQFKDN